MRYTKVALAKNFINLCISTDTVFHLPTLGIYLKEILSGQHDVTTLSTYQSHKQVLNQKSCLRI